MWINNGYAQERITDPQTGMKRVVSIKIRGTSEKAKQDAFKRLTEKIAELSEHKITLSDCIDLYLKEMERSLKPSSIRKMSFELAAMKNILGECYMDKLTAGFIRQKMLNSGKENRTLNGYLKIFKTFWLWAYRNDMASREVCDKLVLFADTPKKLRIQDKYLEPKEVQLLLEEMKIDRWKYLTEFLILSGMRIGEVVALDNKDVWGDIIRITKTYDSNNKKMMEPKTLSSKREIHIQPELKKVIEKMREYVSWQTEVFGHPSDIFYPDPDGQRMQYYSYLKYVREISERVLNRRITPHTFRHTHCSMLAAKGMSLDAISARLGHEDSRITKAIYLHRMEELKKKENEQLDKLTLLG